MLNQSTNFGMRSWLVIEKLPLISFDFHFRESYMDRVRRRQAGWQSDEEEEEDD